MIAEIDPDYRLACLELRGGNHAAEYPVELPGLKGWVCCRPLSPSPRGGDLYYLSACSSGVIARIALADVSGHGEAVSAAAVRLQDALREHVDHWDQSALIRQLNDTFLKGALRAQFATAFLASFYKGSGELLFTNAGHLPPLWYQAARGEWGFMQDNTPYRKEILDLPLGMIAGTSYSQTGIQLEPGDVLLLYTDGVSESSNEAGEQVGMEGLLEIAQGLPVDSPRAAGLALVTAIEQFRGAMPAEDDETVVALQRPV